MSSIQKTILAATLVVGTHCALALPSLRPETTPPTNAGAISVDELGPVYSRPLPAEEAAPPQPPKTQEKPPQQKNDILSLFQDDKPKVEEKNPLEEMAKNEMKALGDPEGPTIGGGGDQVQIGESKQPDVTIKAENAPKEIDLDNASPDSKSLPGILR